MLILKTFGQFVNENYGAPVTEGQKSKCCDAAVNDGVCSKCGSKVEKAEAVSEAKKTPKKDEKKPVKKDEKKPAAKKDDKKPSFFDKKNAGKKEEKKPEAKKTSGKAGAKDFVARMLAGKAAAAKKK